MNRVTNIARIGETAIIATCINNIIMYFIVKEDVVLRVGAIVMVFVFVASIIVMLIAAKIEIKRIDKED